jgi:hypothetical protein
MVLFKFIHQIVVIARLYKKLYRIGTLDGKSSSNRGIYTSNNYMPDDTCCPIWQFEGNIINKKIVAKQYPFMFSSTHRHSTLPDIDSY